MNIHVVGIGHTKFGKSKEGIQELMVRVCKEALNDSGSMIDVVDAFYISNFSSSFYSQCHLPAVLASGLGVNGEFTRVESACASGGIALRQAVLGIISGVHKTVMVVGAEKMTDVSTDEAAAILARAASRVEQKHGATFASLFALIAQRHFFEYGTTESHLAKTAVKNHRNATWNPHAHFHEEISIEDALHSPIIASPLRLLDCSPLSDGAAAVLLCSSDVAHRFPKKNVRLVGIGHEIAPIDLYTRRNITTLPAVVGAGQKAYAQSGLRPSDIHVSEVHDCFTIAELLQVEDLGFCEKGTIKTLVDEGRTEITGDIPVNPSGGLKAKGHPIGATGISQAVEIVKQLRGDAGKRQVPNARTGLICNIGGSGASAVVGIFRRD
jgi:acetyl-CoA C-acetyltransferase